MVSISIQQNVIKLYKYMVCKSGVLPLGVWELGHDKTGQDKRCSGGVMGSDGVM